MFVLALHHGGEGGAAVPAWTKLVGKREGTSDWARS